MDKEQVQSIFSWFTGKVVIIMERDYWDAQEKVKDIEQKKEEALSFLKKEIDWDNLTKDDCTLLRFRRWTSMEEIKENDLPYLEKQLLEDKITPKEYDKLKEQLLLSAKVFLFPRYIHCLIPDNLTVYDIGGVKHTFCEIKEDKEFRYGCLAYGIIPKE